jgi:hypothetical protein
MPYRRIALLAAALIVVIIGLGLLMAWKAGLFYREDYSTPKSAVKSFYLSVVRGDGSSARQNVVEPAQVAVVDEARSLIQGVRNFRRAAIERFGQQKGEDISGGLPTLKDIEEANEKIEGDNAILATKSGKASLRLRKIGANWKIDLLSLLPFKTNAAAAQRIFAQAAKAADELAAKIRAGDFATPDEADLALKAKIAAIMLPELIKGSLFGMAKEPTSRPSLFSLPIKGPPR